MSNKKRIGVILDVGADVAKIESSLNSLRNQLSTIQLPKTFGKEIEARMSKLSDEIKNFQSLTSKMGDSFEGAKQIDASYKKILEYTRKVELSFNTIKKEAGIDASKFFPKEILDRINAAEEAMAAYHKSVEDGNEALKQQKKELKDIETAINKNKKKLNEMQTNKSAKKASRDEVVEKQTKIKTDKTVDLSNEQKSLEILNKKKIALEAEKEAVENLIKKKDTLSKAEQSYKSKKAQYGAKDSKSKGDKAKLDAAKIAYKEAEEAAKQFGDTIRNVSEIKIDQSNVSNQIKATEASITKLGKEIDAADVKIKKAEDAYDGFAQELKEAETAAQGFAEKQAKLKADIEETENSIKASGLKTLVETLQKVGVSIDPAVDSIEEIQTTINNLKPEAIEAITSALDKAGVNVEELGVSLEKVGEKNKAFQDGAKSVKQMNDQVNQLKGQVQQFFSLTNSVMLFRRGVQKAIETVKELDKAMTETAVVTDFSVGDMWDALPQYTKTANELGTTTLGAYETMTLFYQQGLQTNEVFEIGTETMKMARIAGLEYKDATDLMTAALRGFNMELNEASAQRINDVYSELAAITAADTNEIANAMTKTASIANSANMEFETTAALLSQIIETTREPAETAGTAMKTIIARFTEMKKATSDIINVDGEEINVNKVEAALKSAGVALRDVNGEFRDLDDVFLELSSKWNGLDQMTQRYVATMAAGSRQQSRFIAMMQDYDRTMELVDAAYNSSGASQKQFEKTQDSLESKINKLKNAWNEFLTGITNSKVIKAGVDALTGLLNIVNKLTGKSGLLKLVAAIGALKGGSAIFNGIFNFISPLKGKMGKSGEELGESFLQGLAQKINNFKLGQGFVLDVDVGEKGLLGLQNKINTIKQDFASLRETMKTPLIRDDSILVFEKIDDKIIATGVTAKGVTNEMQGELSQTSIQAILASEGVEEIGEDFTGTGIKAKTALDVIQKEYLETIALAEALDKANDGDTVNFDGDVIKGQFTAHSGSRQYWKDRGNTLKKDMKTIESGGTTALSAFKGMLPVLGKIAIVIAAIAAIAASLYAAYNLSPFKQAKNDAEMAEGVVNDYNRAIANSREEATALNNILSQLEGRAKIFENLTVGTVEWYEAISQSNEELLKQIEILRALGYDIDYGYNEQGLIELEDELVLREASIEVNKREVELQKDLTAATYANEVARMRENYLSNNIEEFLTITFESTSGLLASDSPLVLDTGIRMGLTDTGETWLSDFYKKIGYISSMSGAYAYMGENQRKALDLKAQENAIATWNIYTENDQMKKAGERIISQIENPYEKFYSEKAFGNFVDDKYGFRRDFVGHEELQIISDSTKRDVVTGDLDKIIEDLGYTNNFGQADWNEVANALGIKWDSEIGGKEGLYIALDDKEEGAVRKQYLNFVNHGKVDTTQNWEDFIADPGKDTIDVGFIAEKLAKAKMGDSVVEQLNNAITTEVAHQILYGTEDWYNKEKLFTATEDEYQNIINSEINKANEAKLQILDAVLNAEKTIIDENGNKVTSKLFNSYGSELYSNRSFDHLDENEKLYDESLENFVSNIQKLSVDVNEVTAAAYQTFIIAEIANLEDFNGETIALLEKEYYGIFEDLDFKDTLKTIDILNEKIEEGVSGAQEIKDRLVKAGELNLTGAFSDLYKSGIFEEISEDIAKLSDEAGNIDVTATRELIDENIELKKVMDEFNVSGYAMGKILADIQTGEISLTDVNEGLIESYKLLYSAMGQAEDVLYNLRNADLGEDYTEIGRTYEERYKTIKDLYDRKAYGSENFAGNIKSLIGEDKWDEYLIANNGSTKGAWEDIVSDYKLGANDGNLYGSFSSLISSHSNDIFSNINGQIAYDFSGFETYDEILDHMEQSFGVSREYAKAMLADMATYSDTLQEDLNKLNSVANANKEYQKMYHINETDSEGNEVTTKSYTNLSNIKLAKAFKDTKEWDTAKKTAKEEYNKEKGDKAWDTLDLQKQTDLIAKTFKETSKIINTIDVKEDGKDKTYNISKVDSQGNIYYKNDKNETKVQRKDNIDYSDTKLDINVNEPDLLQQLMQDDLIVQAAMELDDKEFQAWIETYANGSTIYTAMIKAGITPESLASVASAKDQMIQQIQAVVDALTDFSVTIPIEVGGWNIPVDFLGIKLPLILPHVATEVTIGGEGTRSNPVNGSSGTGSTSGTGTLDFGSNIGDLQGTGYEDGSDSTNGDSGGGGGSDEENDTNPRLENANKKLEALERKLENREINEWEFQQEQEKLYAEKTAALEEQKRQLEKEAKYLNKYYKYDEETDAYVYLADAYNKQSDAMKNKIDEELAKIQETNDQLNEVEDAIRDLEFKNPYDEERYYEGYSQVNNSDRYLETLERERTRDERYKELAGKGPEELQGVLNALFTAKEILNESKEIDYNLDKYQGLKSQINAKWNDRDFKDEEFYYWDEEAQNLVLDEKKISNSDLNKETRDAIIEEYEALVDMINELYDVGDELDGGLIQDAFKSLSEMSFNAALIFDKSDFASEWGATELNKIFDTFEKKLGLSDKALDGLTDAIVKTAKSSEILDKRFKGLGIENIEEKINNSPLGKNLNPAQKNILTMLGGEGGTFRELIQSSLSSVGLNLDSLANAFNFDILGLGADLFNIGGELIDQGKQMVEKIIGYITQAVQVIVDAWTSREDYLYNFLQIIEKHMRDYEKLQRQENQIEKGRTASVDEIKDNWDNQWKSLQTQLEEQQERLETRQKELERSRYSIFSLISGWDPSTDTMYENRSMKFAWDLFIGFGSAFAPMGLGSLFGSLNQLYEDYDQRVQNSYEDRLAAEQAILDIEDERLELVKKGQEETIQFEEKVMEAFMQQQQEQIEELTRLNDAIADANSKLIDTLKSNLDKMRQDRENEKTEEDLGEKERRLAYLRQDTSGANLNEIKKLEEQLDEGYESYTDKLIDQKISELQEQNDKAAEQRQQQIELLQGQLEYAEKYGLYWDAIYNMLYTFDEYGNAILNPDNFDLDGNIRENGALAQLLGTYTDRIGMSVWGALADADELKYLGKIYGAFIEYNGVTGKYKNQWALDNPGANDPNHAQPEQELPPGLLGRIAEAEIERKKRRLNNNPDLVHRMGRTKQSLRNFWGKLFGNDDWANYVYEPETAATVTSDIADRYNRRLARREEGSIWANSGFDNVSSNAKNLSFNSGGTQNYGDSNVNNYFNIGSVGESVSLDDMADRVANIFKNMFSTGNNVLRNGH